MDMADVLFVKLRMAAGPVVDDEFLFDPLALGGPVQISSLRALNLSRTRSFITSRTTSISGQLRPECAFEIRMLQRCSKIKF